MPSRDIRECAVCHALSVDGWIVTVKPNQGLCAPGQHDWHAMRLVPRDPEEERDLSGQ